MSHTASITRRAPDLNNVAEAAANAFTRMHARTIHLSNKKTRILLFQLNETPSPLSDAPAAAIHTVVVVFLQHVKSEAKDDKLISLVFCRCRIQLTFLILHFFYV